MTGASSRSVMNDKGCEVVSLCIVDFYGWKKQIKLDLFDDRNV